MKENSEIFTMNAAPEHRLGIRGKWDVPDLHKNSALEHGLRIKAKWLQNSYSINSVNGSNVATILPELWGQTSNLDREQIKHALKRLHQPLRAIASQIIEERYEHDIDALVHAERAFTNHALVNTRMLSRPERLDLSVEDKLRTIKASQVEEEAELLREDFFRIVSFISQGSVQEEELHNGGHGEYDDHDDGCEVVAEELELEEAKKNASETSGLLLQGFRFSRKYGKYRLSVNEDFAAGAFTGEASQQLHNIVKQSLDEAMGQNIEWPLQSDKLYLSSIELERLCYGLYERIHGPDAQFPHSVEEVLREEVTALDIETVDALAQDLSGSRWLDVLSTSQPDEQGTASVDRRMAELSTAVTVLQTLIDNPDMRAIRAKYNKSKEFAGGRGWLVDENEIEVFCSDMERLQRVIDRNTEEGNNRREDLEAIAIHFRDTIAGGREIVALLDRALRKSSIASAGAGESALQLSTLDAMLARASVAPTTLHRSTMNESASELAHYIGRHTGQEGVDLVGGFEDFVEDFGGEVLEFAKKHKILTTALALTFFYSMTAVSTAGQDTAAVLPDSLNQLSGTGVLTVDPSMLQDTDDIASMGDVNFILHEMTREEQERKFGSQAVEACHYHVLSIDYLKHCLSSDLAVKKLQDTYMLVKGPLDTVLNVPADGVNLLAPPDPDAPPIYMLDNFKSSLRSTGEVWFAANGYQNLAHGPWAGVSASMGYKLGVMPAIRKTSGLITPLLDGAYGLTADNKYLLANIPALAYGYGEQGISGAVMATTVTSLSAYGFNISQNLLQRGVEFLPRPVELQKALPDRMRFGHKDASFVTKLTSHLETERYDRAASGLWLPSRHDTESPAVKVKHVPSVASLPPERETQFELKIGGKKINWVLDAPGYEALTKDLAGFAFLLEHAAEQIGAVEPEREYRNEADRLHAERKAKESRAIRERLGLDHNRARLSTDMDYVDYLQRVVETSYDALQNYAQGEISADSLQQHLQSKLETIARAQSAHIVKSYTLEQLTEQQQRSVRIKGQAEKRDFKRSSAQREDNASLLETAFNLGRHVPHLRSLPFTGTASMGVQATKASAVLAKTGVRKAWEVAREGIGTNAQLAYNSLSAKQKGHLIGAFGLTTMLAAKVDMDPQAHQWVQDMLPFAGQEVADAAKIYSGVVGHGLGASTATGLFAVYNFAEDHLVIHITMGYACIVMGGGARVVAFPIEKAGQAASVLAEELADISKGYADIRKVGQPAQRGMEQLRRLTRDINNFEQNYLPSMA